MKKIFKKAVCLILAIAVCFSLIPISASAESGVGGTEPVPTVIEPSEQPPEPSVLPTQTPEPDPVPDAFSTPEPEETQLPTETASQADEPEPESTLKPQAAEIGGIQPILFRTVNQPLVRVTYHYYAHDVSEIQSSHSFYAGFTSDGQSIMVPANKYPDRIPVSTDRFRVTLDGSIDVTGYAAYDAESGTVSLPGNLAGHDLHIEWYCPASEITELPVTVMVSTNRHDVYEDSAVKLTMPSNADTVSIPLTGVSGASVSQNGVDLPDRDYSIENGTLTIHISPLGGTVRVNAAGIFPQMRGRDKTTIISTRDENQIYYGYYTKYYWADGNQAFCLDPTVKGASNGEYAISRYLDRNGSRQDQTLIKIAYYGFGGPGFDSVKEGLFGDNDNNDSMYALCHVAAAYVYLDDESAFKGLGDDMINHVKGMVASFESQPMPPEGFDAFIYNEGRVNNQQPIMSWDYTPTGSLEIIKVSADPSKTNGNPCYSLAGAVFDVYSRGGQKIGTVTTDAGGRGSLAGIPAGTGYYLVERTSPKGYAKYTGQIAFAVTSGQTTTLEVKNVPQNDPADILLRKQDADNETNVPQGGAGLMGAEFTIRYYKGLYATESELSGKQPERTWIVRTDADGYALLHPDYLVSGDPLYYGSNGQIPTLPLGTVTIRESKSPEGYLLNKELFIRQITADSQGMEAVRTYNAPVIRESVIRGGVSVQKWDNELEGNKPQGDGTLAGATFEIMNRSAKAVTVGGKSYAPGEVVYTMKTDETGTASTANDLLPYGKYEVRESENGQPEGYLHKGALSRIFEIRENGKIVSLNASGTAIKNDVIRGGVRIEKWDAEIDGNKPQGGGTLAGAVFEIINRSKAGVLVNGTLYAPGEVVHTMTTDETGAAGTTNNLLPYGTYEAREATPPDEGYLHTGVLSRTFSIRENGVTVNLDTPDTAIKNEPIRGDLKGVKITDGNAGRLANVPFTITSLTTGESHTIITDRNGQFDTSSAWNPHSQNTNRGTTDRDGIWFGELDTLDDELGALLYDDYLIEEQRCEANKDMELLSFEVSIYRHNTVVNLGTLTDDYGKQPEIFTTAIDAESMLRDAYVSEETTLQDTVYYSGLSVGKVYTAKGVLMDKETGLPLLIDGKEIAAETTFRAAAPEGTVTNEFMFNSLDLAGKSVVVFETLETDGKAVAEHKDIEDKNQTIRFRKPEIRTSAVGTEGEKELDVLPEVTIVDTVTYKDLIAGEPYMAKGVLMDKEMGEPILIDGEPITAQTDFVPETEDGTIEVAFTFNSVPLKGKTVVVFESLQHKGREIAAHADIEDKGQTVKFKTPAITTFAAGENGGKELLISNETVVRDVVTYESLAAGVEYTLKGVLIDKETGEALLIDGKEITAETAFTPIAGSGSVGLPFTFNSLTLPGKELIVFQEVYQGEERIAQHTELESAEQSVRFLLPEIGTELAGQDGGKEIPVSEEISLVDTVSYQNLMPGKEYVLKGILMDQETGQPILVNGKEITAETIFTPEESAGTAKVIFLFPALNLTGKTLVAFEYLECSGIEIAVHTDMNDAAQTVTLLPPPGNPPKTGDTRTVLPYLVICAAAAGLIVLAIRLKKKHSKKMQNGGK